MHALLLRKKRANDGRMTMSVERLVVKVGTSTLTDPQGRIDRAFIADLTIQLAALRAQGCEVLLVTSGAIRAGREALEARRATQNLSSKTVETLPFKQAAAAIVACWPTK